MKKSKIKPVKVTQKELAEYLGVDSSAITHYKNNPVGKRKVFLMIKGLQKIKEEKKDISQNNFLLGGKYSEVSEEIKKSLPKMII